MLVRQFSLPPGDPEERQEHDHSDRHVEAVEPGQHEEGPGHRVRGEGHVVVDDELGELEDLPGQEDRAEGGGGEEPGAGLGLVVAGQGVVGQHHREGAHQKHE